MALRDAAGVLNGLKKVAEALYTETSLELQRSLPPLASSLYKTAEETGREWSEYGELRWAKSGCNGSSGSGFPRFSSGTEYFPEWKGFEEEGFPTTSGFSGLPKQQESDSAATQYNQTHTSVKYSDQGVVITPPSTFPSSLPPSVGDMSKGNRRSYHTFTRQHPPRSHSMLHNNHGRMWFHSSTWYGNETVVGGGSSTRRVETATKSKRPRPKQKLSSRARERAVPTSRVGRIFSFGGLVAGLGLGTAAEVVKRSLGVTDSSSIVAGNPLLTEANVERIVNTLCTVRGAALKMGQMISLQDSNLIPEPIQEMFDRVRNSADFMPLWQMEKVLEEELGNHWRDRLADFDPKPLAAASIGQVHSVVLPSGQPAAMKIQYPGVAQSIDSDIDNLMAILKLWNILPEGLFIDEMVAVARRELAWETDYIREAKCQNMFRELLANDSGYLVPEVFPEVSTKRVLTTELIQGIPLDQCASLPQETRNDIASRILDLVMRELFEFRFMQTDPNWSNFFYNTEDDRICLLDFGASREYPKMFTDHYLKVIHGSIMEDKDRVLENSKAMGFLTGYESKALLDAHYQASLILGEPFKHDRVFDFSRQDTTAQIHRLVPILLDHRLTPPPNESYSLHRKLSGAFLLCTRLRAEFNCHEILKRINDKYTFQD